MGKEEHFKKKRMLESYHKKVATKIPIPTQSTNMKYKNNLMNVVTPSLRNIVKPIDETGIHNLKYSQK